MFNIREKELLNHTSSAHNQSMRLPTISLKKNEGTKPYNNKISLKINI